MAVADELLNAEGCLAHFKAHGLLQRHGILGALGNLHAVEVFKEIRDAQQFAGGQSHRRHQKERQRSDEYGAQGYAFHLRFLLYGADRIHQRVAHILGQGSEGV